MVEKAGRISKPISYGSEEQEIQVRKKLRRSEIWKAHSDRELAKELVLVCKEIENATYEAMANLARGDLSEITGEEIKSRLRGYQGRLIAIRAIMTEFVPDEAHLMALLDLIEGEEKDHAK